MKRDMDLIRSLLLEIERTPDGKCYRTDDSSLEVDPQRLSAHLWLLDQAGFISGYGNDRSGPFCYGLTWSGHEFLDAARSNRVWSGARRTLESSDVSVSVSVLTSLLEEIAARLLGLGND